MLERIVRAIRLDWTVFREIAEDKNAMKEAAIIVAVVTFLSAIGSAIGVMVAGFGVGSAILSFLGEWLVNGILIGWIGWALITYFVGTALFHGKTDIPEMLRVLGYASAPKLLGILGFIPCVGWLAALAGWILSLIAGVLAIREAMDFDTGKAIITVLIGAVIAFVISLLVASIWGIGTAVTSGLSG
jgi:hypothetical protein